MSYWVGRFIHTDDGEHGRVLDRTILRRLSRRQLVELIEAKDVELVAWDEGERLELVAEEYLADEGTHVSLSASAEAARPEPVKLNGTSGGWVCLWRLLGLDGRAGLVDPHPGGQPGC
jgi:hypothetical protein